MWVNFEIRDIKSLQVSNGWFTAEVEITQDEIWGDFEVKHSYAGKCPHNNAECDKLAVVFIKNMDGMFHPRLGEIKRFTVSVPYDSQRDDIARVVGWLERKCMTEVGIDVKIDV